MIRFCQLKNNNSSCKSNSSVPCNNIVTNKVRLELVSQTQYNWQDLALSITKGSYTPYDKALSIYSWLIDNISYDTTFRIHSADQAIELRKGVCQAYCELFYRLGMSVGVDVRIISGTDKQPDGTIRQESSHCWIVVNTSSIIKRENLMPEHIIYNEGEEWQNRINVTKGLSRDTAILIEPTWGAGSCKNGVFTKSNHDMTWFDVSPEIFAFSHFPENPKDQLLGISSLSRKQFEILPFITPEVNSYGFEGKQLMYHCLSPKYKGLPVFYPDYSRFVEFVDIPLGATLGRNIAYRISVKKKQNCQLAIIENGEFNIEEDMSASWLTEGGITHVFFTAKSVGELLFSVKTSSNEESSIYSAILKYKIK